MSDYDLICMIPGWRARRGAAGSYFMHEAAAKQARRAVIQFWDANRAKHDRRVRQTSQVRPGRRKKYRRNGWTDPDSLLRRRDGRELPHSLASRGTPKMVGCVTAKLPGLGAVRLKDGMGKNALEGELRSFQMAVQGSAMAMLVAVNMQSRLANRGYLQARALFFSLTLNVAEFCA